MGEPDKLLGPAGLKASVLKTFSSRQYLEQLLEFATSFARPVIALKSGCLIFLQSNPELLEVLVQSPGRPPRNYGPVFERGQSLQLLMADDSLLATEVLSFGYNRHVMALACADDLVAPREALQVDLRATQFVAAPCRQLNSALCRWSELLELGVEEVNTLVVNELKKEHHSREFESGIYLVPNASRVWIQRAVRKGQVVDSYEASWREVERELRDSSGALIGCAEWGDSTTTSSRKPNFSEMRLRFLDTYHPRFVRTDNNTFTFCSWVPIEVELTGVPCLQLGTRLAVLGSGIHTLERIDGGGKYYWRQDNLQKSVEGWPASLAGLNRPVLATRFAYRVGVKLMVLHEQGWVAARVCGMVGSQHVVELEEKSVPKKQKLRLDLNDFNHTWREVLVDDSGGYDACMAAYKAMVEQEKCMVEDAITGKKLRVEDQLLTIHIRRRSKVESENKIDENKRELSRTKGEESDDNNKTAPFDFEVKEDSAEPFDVAAAHLKNVRDLADCLLRACDEQARHLGCYRVPAFLIVAAPGSGKTWTMKQLAYLLARVPTSQVTLAQAPLVIYVQVLASLIRKYDPRQRECELDFVEFYIRHTCTKPSQRQFLLQVSENSTTIVHFLSSLCSFLSSLSSLSSPFSRHRTSLFPLTQECFSIDRHSACEPSLWLWTVSMKHVT